MVKTPPPLGIVGKGVLPSSNRRHLLLNTASLVPLGILRGEKQILGTGHDLFSKLEPWPFHTVALRNQEIKSL